LSLSGTPRGEVHEDLKEVFLHWIYDRDHYLWSRPLLSKEYPVEALPGDPVLREDLALLARALNSSLNIR